MSDERIPTWTLEGELCKIGKERDVGHALHAMGLLSRPTARFGLVKVSQDWIRGGAETYIYRFRVEEQDTQPVEVVIKACVAFSLGSTLDSILQSWMDRRSLLANHEVITPKLYAWGHGVILEEFVPYDLTSVLAGTATPSRSLLEGLARYAAVLSKLGFSSIGPFQDLRSHGSDVVVVDFGQDLGPPGVTSARDVKIFDRLVQHLKLARPDLQERNFDDLHSLFAKHGGEFLQ